MSTRQVLVEYTGSTGLDIDEPGIVDNLEVTVVGAPTDEQIVAAIENDIAYSIDNHCSVADDMTPRYVYDRDALIASVRREIERRRVEESE